MPRDLSGLLLANKLKVLGHRVTRQSGSHMRLTMLQNGEYHISVPAHNPLKIGMLSAIVGEVALHFGITKEELAKMLF